MATVASAIVLAAVLGVVAWGRVPDAVAAVCGLSVLVVVVGLVSSDDAVDVLDRLLPTLVFLASIFVIAEAVRAAGLFERAGAMLSRGPHTSVRRLLVAISLAASAVVVWVVCRRPRGPRAMEPDASPPPTRLDGFARFVIAALVVLFAAFFVVSQLGGEPAWAAAVGAGVLGIATIVSRRDQSRIVLAALSPSFVVFVAALGVVVEAAVQHGLGSTARDVMPDGDGFWALLAIVGLAAVLANLVNNIPPTLVLLPVMSAGPTGQLLALLVGVNVGPNLTYTGSLATLLWRRVVRAEDLEPSRSAFFRLALLATPLALVLSTVALWLTLRIVG